MRSPRPLLCAEGGDERATQGAQKSFRAVRNTHPRARRPFARPSRQSRGTEPEASGDRLGTCPPCSSDGGHRVPPCRKLPRLRRLRIASSWHYNARPDSRPRSRARPARTSNRDRAKHRNPRRSVINSRTRPKRPDPRTTPPPLATSPPKCVGSSGIGTSRAIRMSMRAGGGGPSPIRPALQSIPQNTKGRSQGLTIAPHRTISAG
jgi:hypothetical protein